MFFKLRLYTFAAKQQDQEKNYAEKFATKKHNGLLKAIVKPNAITERVIENRNIWSVNDIIQII